MGMFDKILRAGEGRAAKKVSALVQQVNALGPEIEKLSDDDLRAKTGEFLGRLEQGAELDDLMIEAFAVVREAAWRVLGQRPYDVQVFGGIVLHQGNIAEMRTGEGKTLTSTLPVYLNSLADKGVHVVTVNDYLAGRDAEWMGRVHGWLGREVGHIFPGQSRDDKRAAYGKPITYGTTNEFGFDYLRDNMAWEKRLQVQRGHFMALIDEVDSILIDEARTPLIISGQGEQSAEWYQVFARRVVPNLVRGEEILKPGGFREQTEDYVVDEAKRTVGITEQGVEKVEKILGIDNLYGEVNTPLIQHMQNALKAKELFKRDKEYIVENGEVKIVDESTGRTLEGRRYSEGLHQAIEAKEGVRVKEENQTLATITLQNYYRTYEKMAGMTGTAKTEEVEFLEIYELGTVVVPTNKPIARLDQPDQIYKTELAKFDAVADEIEERHAKGQPVLVGTTSVERSEHVSNLLRKRGVPHQVLNAKNHEREAHIVAQAGKKGAVTVSTNMAGRGTDIHLGGNAEELAKDEVAKLPPEATDDEKNATYKAALERFTAESAQEKQEVLEAGGLYVIGTERHESRRVDNQLRGRSGRQGDPGESRFFLSLQDDLMRLFNATAVERIMTRLNIPDDVPIEAKMVTKAVSNAQGQVESRNFDIRKNVLKYDDVLNEQRKIIYGQRQQLLEGDPDHVRDLAQRYIEKAIEHLLDEFAPPGVYPEEWDLAGLEDRIAKVYESSYDFGAIDLESVDREDLLDDLIDDVFDALDRREEEVGGEEVMREVERRVILSVVDRHWRQHLYEMDALRDGIGLRAVGQRDPLVEYQREAYDSFIMMLDAVREEAVTYFFHLPVQREEPAPQGQPPAGQAGAPNTPGQPNAGQPAAGTAVGDRIAIPGDNAPKIDAGAAARAAATGGGLDAARRAAQQAEARRKLAQNQPQATSRTPGSDAMRRVAGQATPAAPSAPTASAPTGGPAPAAPAGPQPGSSQPGSSQPGMPDVGIQAPQAPRMTYTSSSSGGSASYGVQGRVDGPPPGGGAAAGEQVGDVAQKDDGTTVRRVASGATYRKDEADEFAGVGRNDPCPCDSGKKFKKCHGAPKADAG